MLHNVKSLKGLVIRAQDGELGTVDQLYFDDETWFVRYFTVITHGWLDGRQVLISPVSVIDADWDARRLDVSLTKKQVESSPDIDTHKPVSRQHEAEYLGYYGYPLYWGGPDMWGPLAYQPAPATVAAPPADCHLRSNEALTGYRIEAADGEIGHIDGFLVDDQSWAIQYIEVATRNWWPGKKVLVSPAWLQRVSWEESKITIQLTREAIQSAPEYVESQPLSREYENELFLHYGRTPYWLAEAKHESSLAVSQV